MVAGRGPRQARGHGGTPTWIRMLQFFLLLLGLQLVYSALSCRWGWSLIQKCPAEAGRTGQQELDDAAGLVRTGKEGQWQRDGEEEDSGAKQFRRHERERHRLARGAAASSGGAAAAGGKQEAFSARKTPRFLFYRLIGNDMPPLQSVGQLRRNTEYLLQHEPAFPDCEKRWVLNRIVNLTEKALIRDLLDDYGYEEHQIVDIPFDVDSLVEVKPGAKEIGWNAILARCKNREEELQQLGQRIRDFMGLNSGRNAAIEDGVRAGARWILCFDANQFVPQYTWDRIIRLARRADQSPKLHYIEVPMVRVKVEQDPSWLHGKASVRDIVRHSEGRMEEGQLIFRNDSTERFNENMAYALAPKQDLLDRTCTFNSTTCLCHDRVWWWTIKTPKAMAARIAPCGVSVRLWNYPEPEATGLKLGDGNARRDVRLMSAKRFVEYVERLIAQRRQKLKSRRHPLWASKHNDE